MTCEVSNQQMRNRILDMWPDAKGGRGKKCGKYSCAPVRKDSYFSYCVKGTATEFPDIVSGQLPVGYDLESEHRKWWSHYASTSRVDRSVKTVSVVEEGIAVFESCAKRRDVVQWLCNKYRGKGHNSFHFKNYYVYGKRG